MIDTYESTRTTSTAPPSKGGLKSGKSNGAVSKHSRAVAPVCSSCLSFFLIYIALCGDLTTALCHLCWKRGVLAKGARPETIMSVEDINMHSQALLNIRDSNKVYIDAGYNSRRLDSLCLLSFGIINVQDERERLVVRRFKFEEPRLEQIQDLEVYFWWCLVYCWHKKHNTILSYFYSIIRNSSCIRVISWSTLGMIYTKGF